MAVSRAEGVFAPAFGSVADEQGDVLYNILVRQVLHLRVGMDRARLPRTVRSAGFEETTATAKAMVRSLGSMRCAMVMMGI